MIYWPWQYIFKVHDIHTKVYLFMFKMLLIVFIAKPFVQMDASFCVLNKLILFIIYSQLLPKSMKLCYICSKRLVTGKCCVTMETNVPLLLHDFMWTACDFVTTACSCVQYKVFLVSNQKLECGWILFERLIFVMTLNFLRAINCLYNNSIRCYADVAVNYSNMERNRGNL